MNGEIWIRVWSGNVIACDLIIDRKGFGAYVTRPEMPDNSTDLPDLQIDPWRRHIRHQRNDVEEYGQAAGNDGEDNPW